MEKKMDPANISSMGNGSNLEAMDDVIIITNVGVTLNKVFCVITWIVQSCLVYSLLTFLTLLINKKDNIQYFSRIFTYVKIFLIVLVFTLLGNYVEYLIIPLVFINILILYFLFPNLFSILQVMKRYEVTKTFYITNYKSAIQLSTAVCILAVDFDIFSTGFSKVEVYGIGMMDTAVGAIIFSNALTSRISRHNVNNFISALKVSFLLILIGMIRLIVLSNIGYHVNTSEYGVHWNFFFTIAVVKIFGSLILLLLKRLMKQPLFLFLSLFMIFLYQCCLSLFLANIVDAGFHGNSKRDNFFDANREGITSCIGYLAIYFMGIFFGQQIFRKHSNTFHLIKWLFIWFCIGVFCMNLSIYYVTPISRQMSNISYFFFQIFFNVGILLMFLINDVIIGTLTDLVYKKLPEKIFYVLNVSFSFQGISSNQLVYFLLANILTGITNLCFDTKKASTLITMIILGCYMFLLDQIILFVSRNKKQLF